jgi:hypothetical protein
MEQGVKCSVKGGKYGSKAGLNSVVDLVKCGGKAGLNVVVKGG